ncbi:MAG: hypothetical protein ACTHZ7_14585 [Sphingobacterium sp.]
MNILKKINSWAILVALFTCGVAFAVTPSNPSAPQNYVEWGRLEGGGWEMVQPNSECDEATEQLCKESFPEGQDPNTNPNGGIPSGTEEGFLIQAN